MPQDAPQLDPQYDWAKLPDGSYAKFKKGTSRVEIEGRLTAAGILPKPKPTAKPESVGGMSPYKTEAMRKRQETTAKQGIGEVFPGSHQAVYGGQVPWAGFTPSNVAEQIGSGALSIGKFAKDVGKDLLSNPNWFATMPQGQRPSTMQKFVTEPAKAEYAKGQKLLSEGRTSEGVGHMMATGVPLVGPFAASIGEQAGRGDVGGAVGQAVGLTLGGKVLKEGGEMVVDKTTGMLEPSALRRRAADLNTRALRTADPKSRDFGRSVGLQVAKERIIANMEELPRKIEAKRVAKNNQVQALAKQLDAGGTTIDISQDLQPIINDVQSVANQRGLLTPQLRTQIKNLINRVTTQVDPQTGKPTARNLSQMKVSDALALQKGLEDMSAFGKQVPNAISNLARRVRGVIGDKLGATSPDMQRLRMEESRLIKAREAAKENYAKSLNDNRTLAKGFVYSTAGAAVGYITLKMAGVGFGPAIAGILVLRTLAESTPSRTARAAFYARAADAVDAALGRGTRPSPQGGPSGAAGAAGGPNVPQAGGSPTAGGTPPQAVANAQLAAAIGTPQAVAAASAPQLPAAPASIADVAAPARDTAAYQKYVAQGMSMSEALKAAAKEVNPPKAATPPSGTSPAGATSADMADIRSKTAGADVKAEASKVEIQNLERKLETASPDERQAALRQLRDAETRAAEGGRSVAKSNIKTTAKSPEALAEALAKRNKAMMDRLDVLMERQSNPKSGADRNAIEREITQIKRLLSGEATGSEATAIQKRIADRERLAGKRAEAKAATPGTSTTAQTGSTAEPATRPEASPENRTLLLDMGYKKLAEYEGGPEMVKALQKMAKDVSKVDPSYDEVTALADALKALKEVSGQ